MYDNKSVLAVVPARGGSKGIKLKNLREIRGRSLVNIVATVIAQLDFIDFAVCSTDHEAIARDAEQAGLAAPFRRPEYLSGDRIGDLEVLTHALQESERINNTTYDLVLMLQPTSPLRKPEHVAQAVQRFLAGSYDALWSVSRTDAKGHPLKQLVIKGDLLDYYDQDAGKIVARQQLSNVYHRNGVVYVISRSCLLEKQSTKGARCGYLVVEDETANIDVELDLAWAEFLVREGHGPDFLHG